MKTKSFIFLLLVLAVAAVVFFLVWNNSQESAVPGEGTINAPLIESASVTAYDTEMTDELKSIDADLSDLTNLENDPSLDQIEKDLDNVSL